MADALGEADANERNHPHDERDRRQHGPQPGAAHQNRAARHRIGLAAAQNPQSGSRSAREAGQHES